MNAFEHHLLRQTRRSFLGKASIGVGALALQDLLRPALAASGDASRWPGVVQHWGDVGRQMGNESMWRRHLVFAKNLGKPHPAARSGD